MSAPHNTHDDKDEPGVVARGSTRSPRAEPFTRRDLFRYALLGALGIAGAFLAGKRRTAASGESCDRDGACRGCPDLAACGLPRGLSARQVLPEKK
ncbi:MAG: hypothetical protein V1809_06745 [Planctomycetota bacterium]